MNTISRSDLNNLFLKSPQALENAKKYFGDIQPYIFTTGFYSAPSWNWGYHIGIVGIHGTGNHYTTEEGLLYGNGIQSGTVKWFEVVTQFGRVVAARIINLPVESDV